MTKVYTTILSLTLILALTVGSAFAGDGIIINELTSASPTSCTETKVDSGIIINEFTGIIINELTGIIINELTGISVDSATDGSRVDCGIIINE